VRTVLRKFKQQHLSVKTLLHFVHLRSQQKRTEQEGQHPLTGQRAANFRLLANQWAELRLVTHWRHGCRAMRRSVCNAGASNAGRSLCIQILREPSDPQPIYWYQSKGNWLRCNFAADSFYIMKLFSRLFVTYCRNCPKDDKFRYLSPFWGSCGRHRTLVDGSLESRCRALVKCNWISFYSAPQCSHCKLSIASAVLATAIPSVCLSVCVSDTRRYGVKTTARSRVQFALSDSKMCLVL